MSGSEKHARMSDDSQQKFPIYWDGHDMLGMLRAIEGRLKQHD